MQRLGSAVVIVALLLVSRSASADEPTDGERVFQGLSILGGGALYLTLEFGVKDSITPDSCRWCEPNSLDTSVRDSVRWDDVGAADTISNLTGYVAAPLLGAGGLVLSTIDDPSARRWFDDVVPVLQAGIATSLINQTVKVAVGRRRPFAYYHGTSVQPDGDIDTSFFSGHVALAAALATSAGTVASLRGYRSAPYLWGGGVVLTAVTAYLRLASDAHYFTDVLIGAAVGGAVGAAVPLLFHRGTLTDEGTAPTLTATPYDAGGGLGMSFGGTF